MSLIEAQVDRIVGPTHHFGGLGVGNVASKQSGGRVSNPAAAAIQGLEKIRAVASVGVPQFMLPPHPRPDFRFLRSLGFGGSDAEVLKRAFDTAPRLFAASLSCSGMWTANAATVSAAVDNANGILTLSVANLVSSVHRAIEPALTLADLRRCLPRARVVPAMPGGAALRDEGAANHMRLGSSENKPGIHILVHGDGEPKPNGYWPRQSLECCQTIARVHGLAAENTFFLKQHPAAIDAGAFHNDVVATSHHGLMIYHQYAFTGGEDTLALIAKRYRELYGRELISVVVSDRELSLQRAVASYLFNSQIISPTVPGPPIIMCPKEVDNDQDAKSILLAWMDQGLFSRYEFVQLRQSMSAGGGPACLRLRVPITEQELSHAAPQCRWSERLEEQLRGLIEQHYPDRLTLKDLSDIDLVQQAQRVNEMIQRVFRQS